MKGDKIRTLSDNGSLWASNYENLEFFTDVLSTEERNALFYCDEILFSEIPC